MFVEVILLAVVPVKNIKAVKDAKSTPQVDLMSNSGRYSCIRLTSGHPNGGSTIFPYRESLVVELLIKSIFSQVSPDLTSLFSVTKVVLIGLPW